MCALVIQLLHVLLQQVRLKFLHVHLCRAVGPKEAHVLVMLSLCICPAEAPVQSGTDIRVVAKCKGAA